MKCQISLNAVSKVPQNASKSSEKSLKTISTPRVFEKNKLGQKSEPPSANSIMQTKKMPKKLSINFDDGKFSPKRSPVSSINIFDEKARKSMKIM